MQIIKLKNLISKKILLEAGESAGSLELIKLDVKDAKKYMIKNGADLEKDFSAFETNFLNAKSLCSLGRTQRKDMPVIDDNDVRQFQYRLKHGYVDINKPFSSTFNPSNPFPEGLSGYEAQDFLERGLKDKAKKDDMVSISIKQKNASSLKPIQRQIYFDKSMDATIKFGVAGTINFLKSKTFFITSSDNYIIDGHHRWLSALIINPRLMVNCLSIDLPIKQLLPLSTAYGDAIGNKRNM